MCASTAGSATLEYTVKASYLQKFPPFVVWPNNSFAGPAGPFRICMVGGDPFEGFLERSVVRQSVAGHPIQVRRYAKIQRASGCHVLYIAGSAPQSAADALRAVAGEPVLTVTDSTRGYSAKGIIHFVVRENRVRFEIDDQAAAQNGLTVSSKLLNLVVNVRPRS
ncbi:MAG: YfiR family protein [Caulobacteraceae bacterium]